MKPTLIAVLVALAGLATAQTQTPPAKPQPVPLSALPLKDGIYWVKGGNGANTGFLVGKTQVLVIDAKTTADAAKAMLAEIAKLTPNPVKTVVLTHSDGDHVNGLAGLPAGLVIRAHANCRKDMEKAFADPKMSALQPYLPNQTITGNRSFDFDGVRVNLRYFGPAHTSGDLVVFFPAQKIAFIGDLAFVGRDPLIHRQKGGTSFGLVQVLKGLLTLDAETFITGHSDPLSKADIRTLLASIEEKQAKVRALVGQGKSLEEVRSAFGLAEPPGQPTRRFASLVEIIYQELAEKK